MTIKKHLLIILLSISTNLLYAQVDLKVQLAETLGGPYTGTLRVYTSSDTSKQFDDKIMSTQPAFRLPVQRWTNAEGLNLPTGVHYSQIPLDSLKPGVYKLVAVLDTNTKERGNSAPGNLYSRKEGLLTISSKGKGEGLVVLNSVFKERPFKETATLKEIKFRSGLLSSFRKKNIFIRAGVILPASYLTDTNRLYQVVFIIPGWGGTHQQAASAGSQRNYGVGVGKDKIYVYLNPESQTPWGLHAFVDSRVNGPWGTALVKEFMPFLQSRYRTSAKQKNTFIMGQSSGGYGALWLALHFPATFGACWATSPDSIDFSSFTGVNLYKDKNFYTSSNGTERGIFRVNGIYQNTLKESRHFEDFEGDGGQQQSFEAEFGKPDKSGRPKALFDLRTGSINKRTVEDWKQYDLALMIANNWLKLRRSNIGKIFIYAGEKDNFLLNESVQAFGEKARKAGADISINIIPGADHFSVRSSELTKSIQAKMDKIIE